MAIVVRMTTEYGNGMVKSFVRYVDGSRNDYVPLTPEERAEENRRLRGVKSKGKLLQRVLSADSYQYFSTLTTDDMELANDGAELLNVANKFLRQQIKKHGYKEDNFVIVLETFANYEKGYHLHILSDFPIDLYSWWKEFGSDKTADEELIRELGEEWVNDEDKDSDDWLGNLYCQPIRNLEKAANYIAKKVDLTKDRLENELGKKRVRIYKSNVELIKKDTRADYYEVNDYEDIAEIYRQLNEDNIIAKLNYELDKEEKEEIKQSKIELEEIEKEIRKCRNEIKFNEYRYSEIEAYFEYELRRNNYNNIVEEHSHNPIILTTLDRLDREINKEKDKLNKLQIKLEIIQMNLLE